MHGRHCPRLARVYLPLLLIGGFGAPSASRENAVAQRRPNSSLAGEDSSRPDFRVDGTVVLIHVAITDEKGRFVTGLEKENFRVFEEKTEQEVRYFSAEEAPLSVGLVLDFSRSMTSKFSQLREAVAQFLTAANPEDEFCLVEFRDRAELTVGFTQAPEQIQRRVASAQPNGSTALLDAVYLGLRQMKKAHNPRKALLVVSDGGDNHSRFCSRDVKNLARESDVEIYAIGVMRDGGAFENLMGSDLLSELSEQGGGRYYQIDNAAELPAVAAKIGQELRHQYLLGYTPTNQERDGKYRRVRVKVVRPAGLGKLSADWRRGYYAPAN